MENHLFFFLRSLIFPFILIFFTSNFIQAQNPASPDTTVGLGTFNGTVRDTKVQTDGKILVAGDFTYYKTTLVNKLARLNQDGMVDRTFNINSGVNNSIYSIAIQTDGKILVGGLFTSFNGISKNRLVRLNPDGSMDNTFNIGTGANYDVYSISVQPDGKILVGGAFMNFAGISKNSIVRLNSDGTIDNTFTGFGASGSSAKIYSIVVQPDAKILLGGSFNSYNSVGKNCLVRLNSDGSVDNTFNIGTGANNIIYSVAIQPDGKILAGGLFTLFNSVSKNRLVRLNGDGSIDNTFNIGTGISATVDFGIYSIAIQSDSKILAGGWFNVFNGIARNTIVRLNADGSLDNTFTVGAGSTTYPVYSITLQSDNRILAGGAFTSFNNIAKNYIVCLNTDGSEGGVAVCKGADNSVSSIVVQPDDKILVGGSFENFNGVARNRLARLNPDGTVDHTFKIGTGADSDVGPIVLQVDGKILAGGAFTTFNGIASSRLIRLNQNGSIDNTFNIGTGANNYVYTMAIQPDGKILVGGIFTTFNSAVSNRLVRLNSDGSIDNTFNIGLGANNYVFSLAVQADGKILVGGAFTNFNGAASKRFIRLNQDGSMDNTFNVTLTISYSANAILLQPDGKILFSNNGVITKSPIRLNTDGSVDNTFNTGILDSVVSAIALQADGKIIAGGSFTKVNGITRGRLVRFNPDGTIDNGFDTNTGFNFDGGVSAIALQKSGKIFVGGRFTVYKNNAYNNFISLPGGNRIYDQTIRGNIFTDNNHDCNYQVTESPYPLVIVKVLPGPYYVNSNSYGQYQVKVDSGTVNYTLTHGINNVASKYLISQCATSHNVALTGASKDTCCFNFADSTKQCKLLHLNIQATRLRPCLKNITHVSCYNYGNADAQGVQAKMEYPSDLIPLSSVPMWTSKQGNILIYDLGTVQAQAFKGITITDSLACAGVTGLTRCIKATISPGSNCLPQNPAWDLSSIEVTGLCNAGTTNFTITNKGLGTMTDSLSYRIFINDTLIFTAHYKLISNQSLSLNYPTTGETIRLEADQNPFYPGSSRPRVTVEGCGATNPQIPALVITAPQDDLEDERAITCLNIRNSYDPNDKQAIPSGIGATNRIAQGEEIEYVIRFQNTGTDTAYTVKIVDTLDVNHDVSSFAKGISSHPYTMEVSGKGKAVLTFNFYNINLPDSSVNRLASQGLVSFRIKIPSPTPIGTVIKNKAYIFFDYNSPIITNETMHTVDNTVETDLTKGSLVQVGQVTNGIKNKKYSQSAKIYPNPSSGIITVEIPDYGNNMEMRVYSLVGVLSKSVMLSNTAQQQVTLEGMPQGLYFYEIWQEGERKAGGKLQIR
jgi:uncharacterized delta-60 repeat protein/uncharacterized repeat protein (TIGR01451 family)